MENKTCGECKNRYSDEGTCPVKWGVNDTDDARNCDTFEPRTITYGDRIRQMSDEELAKMFVYFKRRTIDEDVYGSILFNQTPIKGKQRAIEETLEELKKEVKNE